MKKILSFFAAALISLASFAQTSVTYTVDKYSNELPSNATKVLLNVYPANFGDGVAVDFIGNWATDVTITDSENNNLGLGGTSPVTDVVDNAGCEFQVNFDNAIISDAIAAAMQQKICYMLSFKEGSLQYDVDGSTKYTNKYPVTAYLYFWDAVDFFASAAAPVNVPTKSNPTVTNSTELPQICDHQPSVSVYVKAQGHWGLEEDGETYNPYTIALGGKKATITGDSESHGPVSTTATISKGSAADEYVLTFDNKMYQVEAGKKYTVTIPEGAFTAKFSESNEFVMTLDVCAHPVFTVSDPVDMDPNNVFEMPISVAADHSLETIDVPMTAVSSACTVDGVAATFAYTSATATTGTIKVTTAEKLAAGSHSIVIPAGSFKANLCTNTELTATIYVDDVVWTYNPSVIHINDATTEYDVTVGATFQGTPLDITDQTIVAKLDNGTAVTMTYVSTDVDKVNTYHVVMPGNIPFVAGKDDANPTEHLNIAVGSFKADDSENTVAAMPIVVVEYVKYSIDGEEILIDNEATEFTFNVYTKNGSDIDLVREITSNVGQDAYPAVGDPSVHVAFNGGFGSQYPIIVPAGDNKITAKFPYNSVTDGYNLNPGNYQLNIPVGALWADANENDNKMFVNFRVMNHIDITVEPDHECVASGSTTATVQLKGWDKVDEMDATVNVKVVDASLITIDGTAVTSCVATANAGEYVITFPAALAEGSHELVFAANAVKANASYNAELTYTINAEDFVAENVTINQNDTEFDVKVSDEAVTVLAGATATIGTTPVTLTDASEAGYIHVTMPAALAKGSYTLTIAAAHEVSSFEGAYAHQYEDLTCTVDVINEFFFVDNCSPKATTTESDINDEVTAIGTKTFDVLHYTRKFAAAGVQQLALPFSIEYDEVAADVDLYRIAMIHYLTDSEGELVLDGGGKKQLVIELKKMKSGDHTVANRPYVVKAKAAGTVDWTFTNKDLEAPALAPLTLTTAFDQFVIKNTINKVTTTDDIAVKGAIICSGSAFKFNTSGANVRAWSWYGALSNAEIENDTYVKVAIDGELFEDGEATGIATLFTESENADIYNVAGQKLNKAQKGINIVNGKKILVK